jgi:hypothetical protein
MKRTVLLLLVLPWVPLDAVLAAGPGLVVDGTEFVLTDADGSIRRSADLVGAELDVGDLRVRIDGVSRDREDPSIWLHRFSVHDGSVWSPLCEPDADGVQAGFPLAGDFDANGALVETPGLFSLTCTSGAQGKCVRFGYAYWKRAADGTRLEPLYQACLRMVRADYCGDGRAATRDGTMIDVYDDHGIQSPTRDPGFRFEAGWSARGAACVEHARLADDTLGALVARCPRLAANTGLGCTEAAARAAGAVLFNRSK